MKVIFKWPLRVSSKQTMDMAADAKVLAIQLQPDVYGMKPPQPVMWTEQRVEESVIVERTFVIQGTGNEFDDAGLTYVGTFQSLLPHSAPMVWHLYEQRQA